MTKIIFFDIDGTLIHGTEKEIPQDTMNELIRLDKKGFIICPASGRQYSSLRKLFAPLADKLYYICENGTILFGPGHYGPVLDKSIIGREQAMQLGHAILDDARCEVLMSGSDVSYIIPKTQEYVHLLKFFVGNNVRIIEKPEDIKEDIIKISAYCVGGTDDLYAVRRQFEPLTAGIPNADIAGSQWLDYTVADKGTGVKAMCRNLGVSPEEAMAFGDNWNDVGMLKAVGTPYIMENAYPELKEMFPLHCTRVDDILHTM